MRLLVLACSLVLVSLCVVHPAVADTQDYPVIVPADWAGRWIDRDTLRDCGSEDIVWIYAAPETLCEGQSLPKIYCTWSGTANSTTIDVSCSTLEHIAMGLYYLRTYHMVEVRDGEFAQRTVSIEGGYASQPPDMCQTRTGVLRRVGPATICNPVSVRKTTWGSLKLLYR